MAVADRSASRVVEEKEAQVFVAAYRGLALVIAIFIVFLFSGYQFYATYAWLLFGIVCAYTIFKVFQLFRPHGRVANTYIGLVFDLALCASLALLTGGLYSPFLLYSLCPVLTSALFFPKKVTFSIAGISVVSLGIGQLLLHPTLPLLGLYPMGLSIGLLAATVVVLFLIAWLPYMININTSRDIRRKAILSERSRLSREMHDGLAQSLGILHLRVGQLRQTVADGKLSQALPQVNEVKGLIEEAQCQVRGAIDELRAGADNKERLFPALIRYTTEFTQTYGIMCELSMADGKVTLPLPAESELLSIAREALSNVGKHSAASAVDVTVESKKDCVEMTIRDNGAGFDRQVICQGHGLSVMEERALSLGGDLAIITSPGQGTEVKVRLPVP